VGGGGVGMGVGVGSIWGVGALLLEVLWMRLSCNANLTGVKKYYFALGSDQRHMGVLAGPTSDNFLLLT
jgi:hypothetical protein